MLFLCQDTNYFKNLVDKSTVYANFTGGKVELVIYIRLRKREENEYNINYYGGRYRIEFGEGIKHLAQVGPNGEIIMDYSIYDAKEAGFNKVVFII